MDTLQPSLVILPESFTFVYGAELKTEEIRELRAAVEWTVDTDERWNQCIRQSLAVVGVSNTEHKLVGMGCLAGNVRHAVLCDLAVHPHYQAKGIGKAILMKRMHIAWELSIPYLYPELAKTNSLYAHYIDLGFNNTGNGLFRADK